MLSATAAALAAAALAGGDGFVRTCDTRVEGPPGRYEPRPRHDVITGRVLFLGLRDRIPPSHGVVKTPATVTTGEPVTVRIEPLGRTRARLDFDPREWQRERRSIARGDGQRVVVFEPCPPETPRFTDGEPVGDHTGYNGGFLIGRPGCARLIARAPGEATVRRRIALGVRPRRCR